ncbi:hypothetical protein VINI7043_12191, partial [Vibrio nigripulchritudo ATCC 27043]|uniref:Ig-like domain-containing protein n=1 Tax=Vibrio nigripulchritudo TaxID=28173 RepID=UPI00021C3E23
ETQANIENTEQTSAHAEATDNTVQIATESTETTSTDRASESITSDQTASEQVTTETQSSIENTEQTSTQSEATDSTEQTTSEPTETTSTDSTSESTSSEQTTSEQVTTDSESDTSEESIYAYDDKTTLYNLSLSSDMDTVPESHSIQLSPRGIHGDGSSSSLIGKPLVWHVSDSYVASVNESGELTGNARGTTTVSFTIDGLTSNAITITVTTGLLPCGGQINDTDMYNAGGYCLKVIEGYSGEAVNKLFTATPSLEVMDKLGYKLDDSRYNYGRSYGATYRETRIEGEFARFRYDGWGWQDNPENADFGRYGQLDRYCEELGTLKFLGRTNWKRPTRYELYSLVYSLGDLTANYGWPAYYEYWTNHPAKESRFYSVDLVNNITKSHSTGLKNYASCVSYND